MSGIDTIEHARLCHQPTLPYAERGRDPVISTHALAFRYDRHDRAYVDTLNRLQAGMELTTLLLQRLVAESVGRPH